jgi:hypothetical protein
VESINCWRRNSLVAARLLEGAFFGVRTMHRLSIKLT